MKQRKMLDLTSKLSLEALISDTGTELTFKFGKKEFRVTAEEIKELRDWLTKEVLNEQVITPKIELPTQAQVEEATRSAAPIPMSSGPKIIKPGEKITNDTLEARRAVVTGGGAQDLSGSLGLIKPQDQLARHDLSLMMGKAAVAFSKEHINDGGQGNV